MPGGLKPGVGVISCGESELSWGRGSCPVCGSSYCRPGRWRSHQPGACRSGEHPPTHKAGSCPLWGPQSCSGYCWGLAAPCWSGWAPQVPVQGAPGPACCLSGSSSWGVGCGARGLPAQALRAGQGWSGEGRGLQGTHAPRSLRRGILKAAGPWQAGSITVWVGAQSLRDSETAPSLARVPSPPGPLCLWPLPPRRLMLQHTGPRVTPLHLP